MLSDVATLSVSPIMVIVLIIMLFIISKFIVSAVECVTVIAEMLIELYRAIRILAIKIKTKIKHK